MERLILHCDANNFYASVETKLDKTLKDKAIAVCGSVEERHGIVLAKSELAKKYKVQTGDTVWQAKQKCKDLIIVSPPKYDEYVKFSNALFEIYKSVTDKVEPFGMDECWLDCTSSQKLFGNGEQIANYLRERVKKELDITISCGVSFTKSLAKLASDYKKPDATTIISKENFIQFTENMPVDSLLMVGRKTSLALSKLNIKTIGQLRKVSEDYMKTNFGVNGVMLLNWAKGIDNSPVNSAYDHVAPKSVGNGITAYRDLTTKEDVFIVLRALVELVSTRLSLLNFYPKTISIYVKYSNFDSFDKRMTIFPTQDALSLFREAKKLYDTYFPQNRSVRAVSFYTSNFETEEPKQLNMFDLNPEKKANLNKAINKIKNKYGYKSIHAASLNIDKDLTKYIETSDFKPFKH